MKRLFATAAVIGLLFFIGGCSDDAARQKLKSQEDTLTKINERLATIEAKQEALEKEVKGREVKEISLAEIKSELKSSINKRMDEIANTQNLRFDELRKEVGELHQLVEKSVKDQQDFNDKMEKRPELNVDNAIDEYFKLKVENIMEEMIDNRLKEVYPYVFYQKRY